MIVLRLDDVLAQRLSVGSNKADRNRTLDEIGKANDQRAFARISVVTVRNAIHIELDSDGDGKGQGAQSQAGSSPATRWRWC